MKNDRFLLGILIGIGVLIIAALILFFARDQQADYVDESTPEGVARNYLIAVQRGDYDRAYGYLADNLADNIDKPDSAQFSQPFIGYLGSEVARTPVEIGETQGNLETYAVVPVTLLRGARDPFSDIYRENTTIKLIRQDGAWKVEQAPYPYWAYEWSYPAK